MQKIPTLFKRDPENMRLLTRKFAVALPDDAQPTGKWDGTSVAYLSNGWKARREVKPGQALPPDFIAAGYDDTTGKTVGWVPITDEATWRWHLVAIETALEEGIHPEYMETFEAVGPHFQGNPHHLPDDTLRRHGDTPLNIAPLHFHYDGLAAVLADLTEFEGIVWWSGGDPVAKIKRRDFGLSWPVK